MSGVRCSRKITFDGSQKQNGKQKEFMHQIRRNDIDYHVIETESHNKNHAEGVTLEVRRNWYTTLIWKRLPKKIRDYGMRWVCEVMQMTHVRATILDGYIPID